MNKEQIDKSIVLIGPVGVGKSLIAENLSKMTGYPILSMDELGHYAFENYCAYGTRPGIVDRIIERLSLKNEASAINSTHLTRKQKQYKRSAINELIKKRKYYEKLCGDYRIFSGIFNEHSKMNIALENEPLETQLLYENILQFKLLITAMMNIKQPVIIDTCGMTWIDLSDKKNVILGGDMLTQQEIDERSSALESIKRIANRFGTRVFLKPDEYYYKSPNLDTKSDINKVLLENLDGYERLANIVIEPGQLFLNPSDPSLVSRHPLDVVSKERRELLMDKKKIDSICKQILQNQKELIE